MTNEQKSIMAKEFCSMITSINLAAELSDKPNTAAKACAKRILPKLTDKHVIVICQKAIKAPLIQGFLKGQERNMMAKAGMTQEEFLAQGVKV